MFYANFIADIIRFNCVTFREFSLRLLHFLTSISLPYKLAATIHPVGFQSELLEMCLTTEPKILSQTFAFTKNNVAFAVVSGRKIV